MKLVDLVVRTSLAGSRRWGLASAACLTAALATAWLAGPEDADLHALQSEVAQLQARAAPAASAPAAAALDEPVPDWPLPGEAGAVWPWLQQRLQAHGLQLLSLRPQAVGSVKGMPEQLVGLRLHGRWNDWLAVQQAMDVHVPWWLTGSWQVLRADPHSGEVRIELQARIGWLPQGLKTHPTRARVWPSWTTEAVRPLAGEALFAAPSSPSAAVAAATPAQAGVGSRPRDPRDPRQWPVGALRLQGTWHQAGVGHAVLGAGSDLVTVVSGQRLGAEGHRVVRVGDAQVELVSGPAAGPPLRLVLGDKP